MPSPIFDAMNRQPAIPPSQPNQGKLDLIKQYNSFRQDPFAFMLQQRGINIPVEYRNDPERAVKYLINSGQMSQEQLNYITSVAQRMGIALN